MTIGRAMRRDGVAGHPHSHLVAQRKRSTIAGTAERSLGCGRRFPASGVRHLSMGSRDVVEPRTHRTCAWAARLARQGGGATPGTSTGHIAGDRCGTCHPARVFSPRSCRPNPRRDGPGIGCHSSHAGSPDRGLGFGDNVELTKPRSLVSRTDRLEQTQVLPGPGLDDVGKGRALVYQAID